ncbi:MAG TPA: hypothetical protein VEZ59_01440 [Sphingopyxis sp.]|nr:hypothetical protein [Sphingopyxis sp.]
MMRWPILVAALVLVCMGSVDAQACHQLTPAGEAERARQEAKWLRKNSDRIVTGIWHLIEERSEANDYRQTGYVEDGSGKQADRYRLSIDNVINCGFPFYNLEDGDRGRFYLERNEVELDSDDLGDAEDGFIDAYGYLHFMRAGESE